MIFRSQILTCHADKRAQMSMSLEKGKIEKPTGMLEMSFAADATDDVTLLILQTWESKERCLAFQDALPAEKQAFFKTLVASKMECWHSEAVTI
jgi:hypothetical protein